MSGSRRPTVTKPAGTERLVLTPITSRAKTPSCLRGAVSYFTVSTGCYKQAATRWYATRGMKGKSKPREGPHGRKVCLKCAAFSSARDSAIQNHPREYHLRTTGFTYVISLGGCEKFANDQQTSRAPSFALLCYPQYRHSMYVCVRLKNNPFLRTKNVYVVPIKNR